jgi:hypothetical protein
MINACLGILWVDAGMGWIGSTHVVMNFQFALAWEGFVHS